MKRIKFLTILFVCFLLTSCTKPLNRYQSAKNIASPKDYTVKVSHFVTDVESGGSKPNPILLQLSEKGQAKYIESLSALCKEADCFYGGMNKRFPKSSTGDDIDRTSITKRIIFSVQKEETGFKPANRISQVVIIVKNPSEKVDFVKWDKFKTEYGEVDLGKITSKTTLKADAKVSPTFSGTLIGTGEAGVSYQNENTEEFELKKRYIVLSGIFSSDKISLMQEGIVGIDLVGNSSVDITLSFNDTELKDIFRVREDKADEKLLELAEVVVNVPSVSTIKALTEGLSIKIEGKYILRNVVSGDNTIIEGDDSVQFMEGNITASPSSIELLSKNELQQLRTRYFIHLFGEPDRQLQILLNEEKEVPLEFANYAEARKVIDWMIDNKSTIVSGKQINILKGKEKIANQNIETAQNSDTKTSVVLSVEMLGDLRIKEK